MYELLVLLVWLGLWAGSGFIGYLCARKRGRGTAGFVLGILLGPIGWVIALLLPADERAR